MHDLIGSVASLTGFRDRDLIDTTVVSVLADWLQPLSLSMYRCIGEPQAPRLLLQGGVVGGAVALPGDPPWTPMESLPALADCPTHERALASDTAVHGVPVAPSERFPEGAVLSVFPVSIGPARAGLIEVHSAVALTVEQQRLVGGVLKIYRNQIGLLDYSERDTLTGLLNRKTFDERFNKCQLEDAATERYGVAPSVGGMPRYWLGLIDIDHFKRVNDNYGHLMGDEVLLLTAHILRKAFRQGDLLYRFGGEEFVVLLRAPSREEAAMAIERFRQQMEDFAFPQAGRVTASIGFTALRPNDTSSSAFERADQAVYHAKENGRNQQHCHEALIESGALQANEKVGAIELF